MSTNEAQTSAMKEWPKDANETVSFEELVEPLVEAAEHMFKLERQNADVDVPYTGLNIGKSLRAGCFDADTALEAERVRYNDEEQGRSPINTLLTLAVQLGIEQGRRVERANNGSRTRYEISQAIKKAAEEAGMTQIERLTFDNAVREHLEDSQDLLTRIYNKDDINGDI